MVLHCLLFLLNYVFLTGDTILIFYFVFLTNQDIVNIEGLIKNALLINIAQTMVQLTNLVSRLLIYFVFWKFAVFRERQK